MSLPRRYSLSVDVEFSCAQVWDVLAHTDHLNRHVGLAEVFYDESTTDEWGIYRPARARFAGLWMNWREYLFQWEQNERYTVVRRYSKRA